MLGAALHGLIDAVIDHAATFLMSAERERARERANNPDQTVYAPLIVRHHQPWPGSGSDGRRPYQPWPGSERR